MARGARPDCLAASTYLAQSMYVPWTLDREKFWKCLAVVWWSCWICHGNVMKCLDPHEHFHISPHLLAIVIIVSPFLHPSQEERIESSHKNVFMHACMHGCMYVCIGDCQYQIRLHVLQVTFYDIIIYFIVFWYWRAELYHHVYSFRYNSIIA